MSQVLSDSRWTVTRRRTKYGPLEYEVELDVDARSLIRSGLTSLDDAARLHRNYTLQAIDKSELQRQSTPIEVWLPACVAIGSSRVEIPCETPPRKVCI